MSLEFIYYEYSEFLNLNGIVLFNTILVIKVEKEFGRFDNYLHVMSYVTTATDES